jgi:hypothetical protein
MAYSAVMLEAYRGFGFPGADDLGSMFQFMRAAKERATLASSKRAGG